MTSNQRRPGFRLPWSTEEEAAQAASQAEAEGTPSPEAPESSENGAQAATGVDAASSAAVPAEGGSEDSELEAPATTSAETTDSPPSASASAPAPTPEPSPTVEEPQATRPAAVAESAPAQGETSAGFMRDLVEAMRRVAEETRQAGLSDLREKSEEHVRKLEADSERHREELRARAEADIAGVAAWASSEEERIKNEAEQRVVGRRAQLDQQLAAEASRADAEAKALRDRVTAYEGELDAYHAQLSDIADPAAFAAAAKRMPSPPQLAGSPAPTKSPDVAPAAPAASEAASPPPDVHPAEEEVLTARLAELDATLGDGEGAADPAPTTDAPRGESSATEVLVKGLGSFGAITGFRQALASVDGIDGVSLSLGPTGEFVFRAIHAVGFDVAAAIMKLEGEAAKIEERPDGGLRVTLDRAR
jgi:hypothetical protein